MAVVKRSLKACSPRLIVLAFSNRDRFRRSDHPVRDGHGDLFLGLLCTKSPRREPTAGDLFETEDAGLDDAPSPISSLFLPTHSTD
ncbi:MAG: hypothetical protein AAFU59_17165 [Pseudomonadota bacterium]